MVDDRLARTLDDLREFVALAHQLTARGRRAFDQDPMLRLAGEALIARIAEAARRLPDDFRVQHGDVQWAEIRGMRKLLTHEYHRIDPSLVWETLKVGIPEIAARLGLGASDPGAPPPRRSSGDAPSG